MKSIRKKITVCLIVTVLIALVAVGSASITLNYRSTVSTVDQMMRQTAILASERIEQELAAYKNIAMDAGCVPQLSSATTLVKEKRVIIDQWVAMHNLQRGNIIGLNGHSIFDGQDFSDRDYVMEAMEGKVSVSEPLVSKVTGELSIIVAAPIYAGGIQGGRITGVVYFVPQETFLNDIVSSIKVSPNSRAYMINNSGNTIADATLDTINKQNIEQESKSDASLKELAALHADMRAGNNGFGTFHSAEGDRFAAYAPVENTDGWSVAVTAPKTDYLADTYFGIFLNIAVIVISSLASVVVALKLSTSISVPMRACAARMKQLVAGDLRSPVPQAKGQDETAELIRSTQELVEGLNAIIDDIAYLLTEMAGKNFTVHSAHQEAYVGQFQGILQSIYTLKGELSGTMHQINASAGQVSSAGGQVSNGAQRLSQGSIDQASSVEELAATITDISNSAQTTASAAEEAGKYVNLAGAQLGVSVEHVQELNGAMEKISATSEEISKIISAIENIAFQTNILALNAAVEAARAGTAGKGFAVVADEVRNLASKSDEAAKATKELIESSITAVREGGEAVGKVTASLERTSELAGHVTSQMEIVVSAVENQTSAIKQVTMGVDQISNVVQTNSATAQDSAAASEELSAEAASLKLLVEQFRLAGV